MCLDSLGLRYLEFTQILKVDLYVLPNLEGIFGGGLFVFNHYLFKCLFILSFFVSPYRTWLAQMLDVLLLSQKHLKLKTTFFSGFLLLRLGDIYHSIFQF